MKKISIIGIVLGIVLLISNTSNAQHYYTSNGYATTWNVPHYVHLEVNHRFHGYEIAHVEQLAHPGYFNYNVLLHRNGAFVELRFDRHGHIYRTIRHHHYPLAAHHCQNHCGYHSTYFQTYYPTQYTKVVYVVGHNRIPAAPMHHSTYYNNVYIEKPGHGHQNGYKHNSKKEVVVVRYENDKKPAGPPQGRHQEKVYVVKQTNTYAANGSGTNRSGRGNTRTH
ncbi:MAG: hypothetical protein HC819_00250 [Cyclobacteriaceae bacterium]|nr:hypothetical protein [Cyclobacteriaceae bacterium]